MNLLNREELKILSLDRPTNIDEHIDATSQVEHRADLTVHSDPVRTLDGFEVAGPEEIIRCGPYAGLRTL